MGHCLIPLEPWVFWLLFPKQNFTPFLPDFFHQNNELFNEIVKTEKGVTTTEEEREVDEEMSLREQQHHNNYQLHQHHRSRQVNYNNKIHKTGYKTNPQSF